LGREEKRFDADLTAGSDSRKVDKQRDAIDAAEDRVAALKPGTKAHDRASKRLGAQAGMLAKMVNAGVDGAVIETKRRVIDDLALLQQTQNQLVDLDKFIALAEQNPDFLGARSKGAGLEQFFVDAGDDVRAIFSNQVRGFFGDDNVSESVKSEMRDRLSGVLGPGDEVLAQRSTDVELLGKLLSFTLVRLSNPTRFAEAQVKRFDAFTDFRGGTSSQALRDMKSIRSTMSGFSDQTKDRVLLYNRALTLGLEGQLNIGSGDGQRTAIQAPTGFGFPGLDKQQGPTAADFLGMTPEQQAEFLRQSGVR